MLEREENQEHITRPSDRLLRDRFARFLGEPKPKPLHRETSRVTAPLWDHCDADQLVNRRELLLDPIQRAVNDVLLRIRSQGWEAFVVGGTLRDLASIASIDNPGSVRPRDIDILIVDASVNDIERCFRDLIARRTRFGGFHLIKNLTQLCEVHFDIWPLAETWAFKKFDIAPDIRNFVRTPFLNLDAVAVELYPKLGHQRTVLQRGFYDGIASRIIDINFEPNPFPYVCIIRVLIMAVKLQFALTPRLACFVLSKFEANVHILDELLHAQLSHYGTIRCRADELRAWLSSIRDQVRSGRERIELVVPPRRQVGLWTDYPPIKSPDADAAQVDPVTPVSVS